MDKDYYKQAMLATMELEWLGIKFIEAKEMTDKYGHFDKLNVFYSVPEYSTIEVEDKELNERIKTAEQLKILAKDVVKESIIKHNKSEYPDDEELVNELENNFSNYYTFYCKIRKGEVWTKEMGGS